MDLTNYGMAARHNNLHEQLPHYILNRQYQEDNTELYASWDFTGDPCPVVRYELEIRRFDGVVVLPRETVPQGKYW